MCFGSAVNNNIFDVGVMFLMGLVGFLMLKLKIPAAFFLIAFILGPLLEDNFRQSLLLSGRPDSISVNLLAFGCSLQWPFTLLPAGALHSATRKLRYERN